jgi:hypothetical protein
MRGGAFFWTGGVARMQISVFRKNLYSLTILIISGIIQIEHCKVKCLFQVPWSLISTFIFLFHY